MNDIVYVVRDGENPELRYSLRSLKNVNPRGQVWIIGGAPKWVNPTTVNILDRPQVPGSAYASTRAHLKVACTHPEINDPFWLWHDDFFAMRSTTMLVQHRGPLQAMAERFARVGTVWAKGLRETTEYLLKRYDEPLCYDIHAPLLVHKESMLETLAIAKTFKSDCVHVSTLYGNNRHLGGVEREDPKMMRRSEPFPRGAWLSSSDSTFRSCVEPVLRYTFPDPCRYERP